MKNLKLCVVAILLSLSNVVCAQSYGNLPENLHEIICDLVTTAGDIPEADLKTIEFKASSFLTPGRKVTDGVHPVYAVYDKAKNKVTIHTSGLAFLAPSIFDYEVDGGNGRGLFHGLYSLKDIVNLNYLNTINMTDMSYMFSDCVSLENVDVTNLNTYNVTTLQYMFQGCVSLTSLDLSNFNTDKVSCMNAVFLGCSSLKTLDISHFSTQSADNLSWMFSGCASLTSLDCSSFSTVAEHAELTGMFAGCDHLTSLNLTSFDTENAYTMASMFSGCSSLTSLDLSSFNTSNVENMGDGMNKGMFSNCSSLTSLDLSNFNTSKVTTMYDMFAGCTNLEFIILSSFDTQNVTNMTGMFFNCYSLKNLNVSSFNTSKVTGMEGMFRSCSGLTSLDLKNFDTSCVTDMHYLFEYCTQLASLDLSGFDTHNVTDMSYMFNGCSSLTSLDVSGFDTQNVTAMNSMFLSCCSLTSLDVSHFVTSKVVSMQNMFQNCNKLTSIELKNFNTASAEWMGSMFRDCASLTTLDLSSFNTAKVKTMDTMFAFCTLLESVNLDSFNTESVEAFGHPEYCGMFEGCESLESLDLSHFNTSNATCLNGMFKGCTNLASLDISKFNVKNTADMAGMFEDCTSLSYVNVSPNIFVPGAGSTLSANAIITCPELLYDAYITCEFWNDYYVVKREPASGSYIKGDVNNDSDVDVADLYHVAKGIMMYKDENLYFMAADVDGDKAITAADFVGVANIGLGVGEVRAMRKVKSAEKAGHVALTAEMQEGCLMLNLAGGCDYTALQMDVTLPENVEIKSVMRGECLSGSHSISYREIANGVWRVLVTSMQSQLFERENGELLGLVLSGEGSEGILVNNIQLVEPSMATAYASAISLDGMVTGIESLAEDKGAEGIYSLSGVKMADKNLKAGIYVVGGKKVVVK